MKYKIAIGIGAFCVLLVIGLTVAKNRADAHYFDGYVATFPLNATEEPIEIREEGYRRQEAVFESIPGERVPALLTFPLEGDGPFPCVVFLHGIGQRKDFLDEITLPFNQAGFAMASFDQFTRGGRALSDESGMINEASAFLRRAPQTIIDTRRILDYLATRNEIDNDRVFLVGASYGAITGATAAAKDTRFRAVVLVYGGGNIGKMLEASAIRSELGSFIYIVKPLTWYLLSKADPVHYVGAISPRPVLIQNGRFDQLISNDAAFALQEACNDPKTVLWYDSDHVGMEEGNTMQVLNDALVWLQTQNADIE